MTKFLHFNIENETKNMPNKIKKKYQSRTVAAEPKSAAEILDIANLFTLNLDKPCSIVLKVGVTLLSIKDRYNRKEGRAEAVKKMADVELGVSSVFLNETHIFVQLVPYKGVQLNLRLNKKTGFSTVVGDMIGG